MVYNKNIRGGNIGMEWNLDDLYTSFEDEHFLQDMNQLQTIFNELKKYPLLDHNEENLKDYLMLENKCQTIMEKLYSYVNLVINANTQDHLALQYASQLENIVADVADVQTAIQKWIASFDLENIQDSYIQEHLFILKEIQANQKYLLDEKSESVLAKMKTTGSSSWAKYKDQLVSSMTVMLDNKKYALTEVLNMAYSPNKEIRKKAYEAELSAYASVEQGIASALNAIKGEALTVSHIRGYESVLQRTLIDSRMSQKTLNVLLKTMKKSLPMFEHYFRLKAQALGYQNGLPWFEMYAPIIDVNTDYPYQQGCEFVIEQFSTFSQKLGDYAKMAIDNHWIDVYPRTGKVGGAFCQNLHCIQQSRFLLNYGNGLNDVITMAHELGHGFHGHCLNQEYSLNADYPMPIAETASTFCETIVKQAALKKATRQEQMMILENELCDCAQIIVDIYSRFLFESRFFDQREKGPLSVEDIKELMLEAQRESYGKGLDHHYLHPYMWTWKPHYYEADYAFYNFPYAFGLLLAKGLYGMYQKEGHTFAEKYEKFLSLTGKMSLEDIAQSIGIDLQDESFWQNSIDMIKQDLQSFEEILKKEV